jgi:hypothetical protein
VNYSKEIILKSILELQSDKQNEYGTQSCHAKIIHMIFEYTSTILHDNRIKTI